MAMQVFVRVVETGSFSKAAQEFATTQPTVTKMVSATEARLKVRLLNRNTRGVSVTKSAAARGVPCLRRYLGAATMSQGFTPRNLAPRDESASLPMRMATSMHWATRSV